MPIYFGTSGKDNLHGTGNYNAIFGMDGDDIISWGIMQSGITDVYAYGGNGDDYLHRTSSGVIRNHLFGGEGNDKIDAGIVQGGEFDGGPGIDTLYFSFQQIGNVAEVIDIGAGILRTQDYYGNLNQRTISGFEIFDFSTGSTTGKVLGGPLGDDIRAGSGADSIFGYGGDDTINGGSSGDTLMGGDGNDLLDGGRYINSYNTSPNLENHTDYLYGGNGNDRLIGRAGADVLFGGSGTDVFSYFATRDSQAAPVGTDLVSSRAWGTDTIYDFNQGDGDRVDVSQIDANTLLAGKQNFHFQGTAFSGAAGDLIAAPVFYGIFPIGTRVMGDVNGDRIADISIYLDAFLQPMKVSDFILS